MKLNNLLLDKLKRIPKDIKGFASRNLYILLSFFVPFILMNIAFAFHGIYPFGDGQVLVIDLWHQYFPFLVEFREKLINGGSLFYSWNIGMGTNFIALMAYYTSSPLYYLSVFIPKDNLTEFVAFCITLKIGLSGAFFNIYLQSMFKKKLSSDIDIIKKARRNIGIVTVIFSMMYAFCAYSMGYYWCLMWLDCVALLPLIILGLNKLLDEGKFKLYTISLAIAMISNYYIGTLICIFIVFYYIVAYLTRYKLLDGKIFLKKTGTVLLFSIIGVALSCIIIMPTYVALKHASGADSWSPSSFKFYHSILDLFNSMWMNITPTVRTGIPNIYSGLLAFILLPVYIISNKIPRREKIANILLIVFILLCININYLDFVWHVFHFPNELPHRFAFVFSFMVVTMAYKAFVSIKDTKIIDSENNDESGTISVAKIMSIMAGGIIYLAFSQKLFTETLNDATIYINIIFIVLYCSVLIMYKEGKTKEIYVLIMLSVVIFAESVFTTFNSASAVGSSNRDTYRNGMKETRELVSDIYFEDRDFYRIENTSPFTINSSALYSFRGISQFSSSANSNITAALSKLGIAGRVISNRYTYHLSTPVINSMLSLKYLINRTEFTESEYLDYISSIGSSSSYEYKFPLPLGYMVNEDILEWDLDSSNNPFELQNDYINLSLGKNESVFTPLIKDYILPDNISCNSENEVYKYNQINSSQKGSLEVYYTINKAQTVYLYALATRSEDNEVIYEINGTTKSEGISYPRIIELGYLNEGDELKIKLNLSAASTGSCSVYVYGCETKVFKDAYTKLNTEVLKIKDFSDTRILGDITVKEDGILYTSIPYEKGWSATVDGEKVDIIPLNDAFTSLELEKGKHTIEFKYVPEGFMLGILLTIFAIMLLILINILVNKRVLNFMFGTKESFDNKEIIKSE